jgi:hypothetical protein
MLLFLLIFFLLYLLYFAIISPLSFLLSPSHLLFAIYAPFFFIISSFYFSVLLFSPANAISHFIQPNLGANPETANFGMRVLLSRISMLERTYLHKADVHSFSGIRTFDAIEQNVLRFVSFVYCTSQSLSLCAPQYWLFITPPPLFRRFPRFWQIAEREKICSRHKRTAILWFHAGMPMFVVQKPQNGVHL